MESSAYEQRLRELLEPEIRALGFHLVLVSVDREKSRVMTRIYIDALPPKEGVDVEDCAKVSERASLLIDSEALFEGSYVIEVSSRGLHKILGPKDDFRSYRGKRIVVRMDKAFLGKKEVHGILSDVEDEGLILTTEGAAQPLRIPFSVIRRVNLVYDFDRSDLL